MERILVIGANGQIGSELVDALATRPGSPLVFAADVGARSRFGAAHYETLDVLDQEALERVVEGHDITQVYQLAAMLSVTGEAAPLRAWNLNMNGLINTLELARRRAASGRPLRVFWPSSIAAFGPHTPAIDTPQRTVMDPTTMYGISKQAGERLAEYYFVRFGVDVRSLRYPGIISYRSPPGGGTTDYAVAIFHAAKCGQRYDCYLGPDTTLPMMYMPDAIRAAIGLMEAPSDRLRIRSAYNVSAMSFSPRELAQAIGARLPGFEIAYVPDARQAIADSWPDNLDDTHARADWHWQPAVDLDGLVDDMLRNVDATAPVHRAA